MTFEKETMDTTFAMQVYPKKNSSSLQNTIQEYIDSNDKYKDNIELPKEIDEKKVSFYMASDEYGAYVMPLGFVIAVLLFFAKDSDLNKQLEKRRKQMMSDYPEIVSKILLYYGAGLSVKSSIERIVLSYETEKRKNRKIYKYAYEELGICLTKMRNGVSESVAINQYGARCGIHSYIKFASILEQNMKRGTKDMTLSLKQELKEALSDKKNNMLKNGGQVSTKLLGPMVLMLIISIAIIMAPAFMSMEF
jgi:hypothetical protein